MTPGCCIPRGCAPPPAPKRRYSGCGMVEIDASVVKTWFAVSSTWRAVASSVDLSNTKVDMLIFRTGQSKHVAQYAAFSQDENNRVCFHWDDALYSRPPGFYTGDIFINGQYCVSVRLRIRKCELALGGCENEIAAPCEDDEIVGGAACASPSLIPRDRG